MSGRHRKPTQSNVSVAKVAVTGAVIGGGSLALAGQAAAATDGEWDRVASCESSNNWSINTGNGYQGGLQFSPSTWSGHGGGEYASAANLASREQQIAVAERVLASQGRGAWPACGTGLSGSTPRDVPAGATNDDDAVNVEEASAESEQPEDPVQKFLADFMKQFQSPPPDAPPPAEDLPPAPEAPAPEAPAPEAPAPEAPAPEAPDAPAPADRPGVVEAAWTEEDSTAPTQPDSDYQQQLRQAVQSEDVNGNDALDTFDQPSSPRPA